MQIGQMSLNTGPDGRVYGVGEFATLAMALKFNMAPNPDHDFNNDNSPIFIVTTRNGAGALVAIGRAWKKIISRGEHTGRDMYSLTLDDPSFERPLYITAFPRGSSDNGAAMFALDWQRPRQAPAGQKAASSSGDPGPDGDMIPD